MTKKDNNVKIDKKAVDEIQNKLELSALAQAESESYAARAKYMTIRSLVSVGAPLTSKICFRCCSVSPQGLDCPECSK